MVVCSVFFAHWGLAMSLRREDSEFRVRRPSFLDSFIDVVSFSRNVRSLVEMLNTEIAAPENVVFRPMSHPAGFARLITKRRLTIAEAYIKLVSLNQHPTYVDRIEALQVLMHHVWHAKNLSMPINTARVQIALMKAAVKYRENRRRQLELMSDFTQASYGQVTVIRRLLRELDLIEVPETGATLSEMRLGWDDHVHDSMTEGRKSPTQLVLDAFIKGISRITVAYYDLESRQTYEEVFLAGSILGIRIQVGIEFSVGRAHERLHYLYIPKQNDQHETLSRFLDDNSERLEPFWAGLRENARKRSETISSLLATFNDMGLDSFNEQYADLPILQMSPLSEETIAQVAAHGHANRIHLGRAVYQAMKPVALKRVLYLKNEYRSLRRRAARDASSAWEAARCRKRYEEARRAYETLTPDKVDETYIAPQMQIDYDSAFSDELEVLPLLASCGGYIVFMHPLSQGFGKGVEIIFRHCASITDVEVFNLVDAMQRNSGEIRRFASLMWTLHRGTAVQVQTLFREWRLSSYPLDEIERVMALLKERPFYMRCSSDAVGWSSNVPGMGFVHESCLTADSLKLLKRNKHAIVPQPVAALLQDKAVNVESNETKAVYLLASTQLNVPNLVGDEPDVKRMTPLRVWRYANDHLKNIIMMGIGFIPAFYFLGLPFALFWLGITAFRNAIVDLIAASGLTPRSWRLGNVDRVNLCTSLFFTGFSVPILTLVKWGFDQTWGMFWELDGLLFTFVKFWCIAFANGLYLATHNTLRGFDKAAIRGNFFRTVLSWPLATLGSYGLTPLGVPDIVQAKIWSEVVAGLIEGTVKNIRQHRLARKALSEVYRQIVSAHGLEALIARIDVLFFWAKYQQGRKAMQKFMAMPKSGTRRLSDTEVASIHRANSLVACGFKTEGSLENLTYVILEYYPAENLTILTDFIGNSHEPFVEWLEKHYRPCVDSDQ